jgi:hypothetical protein
MRRILASFASLALLGFASAAHATSFSLPNGSTALVGGVSYTITGTVMVSNSNEITGGSFTVDGLPTLGNTTFIYTSDSTQGGGNNMYDTIYYGSLVLYTLPVLKNGDIVICNGACSSGSDSASEPTSINLSFAGSPYSLQGSFGGSLDPVPVSATPEPSSLMLLGTGILGVAGAVRRKVRKA